MSILSVVSVADRTGFRVFASALRSSAHFARLEGAGPFTVFAPTDAAFQALPSARREALLNEASGDLDDFLGYHIAAGRVASTRFAGRRIRAVMSAGGDVIIEGRAGGLRVNAARMCRPDLDARNGVVHGIDALLWPREAVAAASA